VFVFQLFASLPADVLAYGAMLFIGGVAFASGVLFAGLLGRVLLNALRRAGVVKDRPPLPMSRPVYPIFLAGAAVLALALGVYLRQALRGPATIHVGGVVQAPYDYPLEHGDIPLITAEATLRNVTTRYTGVPVRELVDRAQPQPNASLLLIQASDGYAFFVSMDEVRENESLLLAPQGKGENASYNIVGPRNSKAWVRGVEEMSVIGSATLEVTGALEYPLPYDPNDWQFEMDSTSLDVGEGSKKYQGTPLGQVLQAMNPRTEATTVLLYTDGEPVSMSLADVLGDDNLRIFTIIGRTDVSFAVARMDGKVILPRITRVEVR
jgi:DMSO/TMAO reductase YedYZ molybdopterin-dependent catalytic subunit